MMRRSGLLTVVALALVLELASCLTEPGVLTSASTQPVLVVPKFLLWNASASVPRGLYWLRSAKPLHIGELITVTPPKPLAQYMAQRGYLPDGVPLLKHIGALAGQTVCRFNQTVTIDGHTIARARERDSHRRLLTVWRGCLRLHADEVFLLNPGVPDSFDGRYFGVVSSSAITARAVPFWTLPGR